MRRAQDAFSILGAGKALKEGSFHGSLSIEGQSDSRWDRGVWLDGQTVNKAGGLGAGKRLNGWAEHQTVFCARQRAWIWDSGDMYV